MLTLIKNDQLTDPVINQNYKDLLEYCNEKDAGLGDMDFSELLKKAEKNSLIKEIVDLKCDRESETDI